MNTKVLLCSTALVLGALQMGCSSSFRAASRGPASEGRVHEVPPGLDGPDLANFEHLSEGADIYPYEWMRALKSVSFPDKEGQASEAFLSDLDDKFGILQSPNLRNEQGKTFLMPYVGLTASWSSHPPQKSDAFVEDESEIVRKVGNVKSIKMVGTNCALCHSGALSYRGTNFKIDGSPSITNVRGYFIDLAKSTIALLAKQDRMEDFLRRLNVPQPEARAKELNKYFDRRLAETTHGIFNAGALSAKITLLMAAKLNMKGRMFHAKEAISDTLLKLLKITYGFNEGDNLGELPARMKFLGTLMVGTDPHTDETESGFGRTDAFGRIGNLVLRGDDPISYTAPVSLPWIWGLKYMAMLHYNGNSNSVIMRNVGQSLGLGAIILSKDLDSTSNVYNLDRMEHLVHKIKFPEWEKVFAGVPELKIKNELATAGKRIYEDSCQRCHESNRFVGPSLVLREYNIFPLDKVGTDQNSARNAVQAVGTIEFEKSIFEGVGGIKKRYYEKNNITEEQQAVLEFRSLRGNEFFRDTLNGFTLEKQAEFGNNYGNTVVNENGVKRLVTGLGYKARHLSAVWATAPFLHNGSVPTLWDLLQAPELRPKYFNVKSREFDPVRLGYRSERPTNFLGHLKACDKSETICFDTTRTGNHNGGHVYGTTLTDGEKMALLEYLKVLPPEPEYSWY